MECFKTIKQKKFLWIFVLVASLLCIAVCFTYLIPFLFQSKDMSDLRSDASKEPSSSQETVKPVVETPVDFKELKSVNPEIYAWINIPGTNIDYPILQSETDDDFYLTHNVNKKRAAYGSIYTEDYNTKDFGDFNTVIYGHNMRNGTMFASLKKYRDQTFFNDNQYINIYMPERILKYRIFAAYVWDDRHILRSLDFNLEDIRKAYIDMIFSIRNINAHIRNDVSVTESDNIITLSTCTNVDTERYLVQGVLIDDTDRQ